MTYAPESATPHAAGTAHVGDMTMATDGDTTAADNVHPFPSAAPEPQPRHNVRSKDRRAAARQAKKRSKIKADRDERHPKDVLVSAPQTVTQTARNGVTPSRETLRTRSNAPALVHDIDARASGQRHGRGIRFAALIAALGLATVS